MSKLTGIKLAMAATIGLAGCEAAPDPGNLPKPIPTGTVIPSPAVTENCGDLHQIQTIVQDRSRAITARNIGECVAVYAPFSRHQRIGTLAAGTVFGAICSGPTPGSWQIKYGGEYAQTGAVYLTPDFASAFQADVANDQVYSLFGCDEFPHPPFVTD